MWLDNFELRKTTTFATSSGDPIFLSDVLETISLITASEWLFFIILVSMRPGAITLTLILYLPSSLDKTFAWAIIAALVAEYNTVGKKTEMIVVLPKNSDQELFVAEGGFEITEALVANSTNYVDVCSLGWV